MKEKGRNAGWEFKLSLKMDIKMEENRSFFSPE